MTLAEKQLKINVNKVLKATLSHWRYDAFRGSYEKAWQGNATAQFTLNVSGRIESLLFGGIDFRKK